MPWVQVSTKVPDDMKARIEIYEKTIHPAPKAEALRQIISAGLNVLVKPTPSPEESQNRPE